MPGSRTLVEGTGDLRLSDERFMKDLAKIRAQLLQQVKRIEQDTRIHIGVGEVRTADLAKMRTKLTSQIRVMEADAKVRVGVAVDERSLGTARARVSQATARTSQPIRVPVAVDTAPATAALAGFAATGKRIGRDAGQQAASAFSLSFKAGVATGAVATAGFVASAFFSGFQRLTTIQDATTALTVALGDAGQAAKVLDDVLAVVTGTPFNLDQFARAASNMIAFGIEAQKIPGYLTAIGEASATRGSQANEFAQRLSDQFGQISALGRLTGEDIHQFAAVGVPALEILGNAAGKTTVQMGELISKGIVPAEFALDTLAEGILKGSDGINGATVSFEGTMEALRQTLTGSIGGFKAATARFGANFIRPIQGILTEGFTGASGVLNTLGKSIEESLKGFAVSDEMLAVKAFLVGLPDVIGPVIDRVSDLGPALAPISGALAALGLSGLSALPVIGGLIPPIGMLTAAITLFVATTPRLRNELFDVFKDLAKVIGTFAGEATVLFSSLLSTITPALGRIAEGGKSLIPVVKVVLDLGVAIGGALVGGISLVAEVIERVPVGVIKAIGIALAAAFGTKFLFGLVGISSGVGTLTTSLRGLEAGMTPAEASAGRLARGLNKIGVTSAQLHDTVNKAALGVAGAFAGMALASEDTQTKIAGGLGSIAAIATGFTFGGGPGGAIATIGVGVGYLASGFINAKKRAAEFKQEIEGIAEKIIAEFGEAAQALSAQEFLTAEPVENMILEALGPAGLEDLKAAGLSYGEALKVVGDGLSDNMHDLFSFDSSGFWQGKPNQEFMDELFTQKAVIEAAIGRPLEINLDTDEGVDALHKLTDAIELLDKVQTEGQAEVTAQQAEKAAKDEARFSRIILETKATDEQANAYRRLADEMGIAPADLLEGTAGVSDNVADINAQGEDLLGWLDDAQAATDIWADKFAIVQDALTDITGKLDAIAGRRDVAQSLDSIATGLGAIVNQDDIDAAEKLTDEISDQRDTVDDIRRKLESEKADADVRAQNTLARIAENEAVGATQGAALLRREMERDKEKAAELETQLNDEIDRLHEMEAELAAISVVPITVKMELDTQALESNVSLFDLLIAGTTPEAEAAFKAWVGGPIDAAVAIVEQELADHDPAGAKTAAEKFRAGFEAELLAGGLDPATVDQILDDLFDIDEFDRRADALLVEIKAARDKELQENSGGWWEIYMGTMPNVTDVEARALELKAARNKVLEEEGGGWWDIYMNTMPNTPLTLPVAVDTDPATEEVGGWWTVLTSSLFELPVSGDLTPIQAQLLALATGTPVEVPVVFRPTKDPDTGKDAKKSPAQLAADALNANDGFNTTPVYTFRAGGIFGRENHIAQIATAGATRIWREPETGGEGYIPLAPSKRDRSTAVLTSIAHLFGLEVQRPVEPPAATMTGGPRSEQLTELTEAIRQLAKSAPTATQRAAKAELYARGVTLEAGAGQINEAKRGRRTARDLVDELARLALL